MSANSPVAASSSTQAMRGMRTSKNCDLASASQREKERDEVLLFVAAQLRAENEVEELDRVLESRQAAVVQVRRRVFDAAQRECLRLSFGASGVELFHA